MFKKKDSTIKGSTKLSKTDTNNLALLVARMQKNADTVEKDVLRAEELLVVDAENEKKERPFQHQQEIADCLGRAEGLLEELFLDVGKAKKLKHPQASEIENDIIHLHERWLKDCAFYRDVYEPVNDVEVLPRIDWAQVFTKKQKEVNSELFGPTLSDLEKQIAAHNILHKEIESYNTQLSPGTTSTQEEFDAMKKQYINLLDNSKWRHHYLSSLYDYMQGCKKEMGFLKEEQDKILQQDWSDRMVDPPDVRRQYENFKNNSLLSHEGEVNKLQDDGDRLIELKHPASSIVETQRDDLRNEWQKFLNLCICQETHLDNVEEFKKYQFDVDTLSESLTKLSSTVDPKTLSKMSNTETLLRLEAEEKTVQQNEQLLADLRKRSTSIAPLKLRRTAPTRATTIESLCDWTTPKSSVTRGEKLTLKSNADNENWEAISSNGVTKTVPGVCFLVPPPDPEAIDKVDLLGRELEDLKRRRASVRSSLKNHTIEPSRTQQAVQASVPEDPKAVELAEQLDQMDKDLMQAEQDIRSRLRAPLDRNDPARDLANRLREQERAAAALRQLEQQKAAAQSDLAPLLSKSTSGPTSSSLPEKLNAAANKQDSLAGLADLYTKKANASMNLENQIKKTDDIISDFEKQLNNDGVIPDTPHAIQTRSQDIQNLKKDVTAAQSEMQKLNQDLEATEKLCSSLQQGYQEYCPDIQRQEDKVKNLQNRYANVGNQVKERERLLQDAATKNQDFQNAAQSLNSFLDNLPSNKINSNDDLSQISAKQTSQERVVEDIKRKGDDMDRVVDLSQDLQNILNEYERNCDKYSATLPSADAPKSYPTISLADSVQKQEKALVNRYAETSAENKQLLNQMGMAKTILAQNEEKAAVVAQQQSQLQSQQRDLQEIEGLQKELQEEVARRNHAETDLTTFKNRMLSLKNRRGVERVEEKEVLQYYRDPKLEADLADLQNTVHQEALKRTGTQSEIDLLTKKISALETDLKNTKPKLVTREVTEIERDPQLDVEASKLRSEIKNLKDEVRFKDNEEVQLKQEVNFLEQKKPNIKEKVVQKEVVKLEKDPEMLRAVKVFETEISDEAERSKILNNEIFQTRSQINALERLIPTLEPKVVVKEVKKVEQDPELINETKRLQSSLEDEKNVNSVLRRELSELQSRYVQVEQLKPKVEIKEIINEIYRVAPETNAEIERLRKELQDSDRQTSNYEREIKSVKADLDVLRAQKPKVEYKEVVQEVVKEERSPENTREINRLQDQVRSLQRSFDQAQDELKRLTKERDEWKAEKSKVETKLLNKEVVKYVNDPLLDKEADRLRREVREETQRRRTTEEMVFDLENKYIQLERQKPEEKVVVQEVVHLQKDPQQIMEHERLNRNLDDEIKSRRKLELEVQQQKTQVQDKERMLRQNDERQKKIQVETELRQIKSRINELETAPPPIEENIVVEEVLKVERDPKLEKLTSGLRKDMDTESSDIARLERDIRKIKLQLEILEREKSGERTVYKEVIRVEKDQAVETERAHLREQVQKEKNERRDLEDQIRRLSEKLHRLQSKGATTSQEEAFLIRNRDSLQKEKENLLSELQTLQSEKQQTSISFQQQSRLMSERNQMNRQKSIRMESDVQRLEREILDEKEKIYKRDNIIRELQNSLRKEDNSETRTKETNVSTKITILDPDTGKDMSPYDAYMQGLIDRSQYIHLQELECDWEEITTQGRDGETSVLQDRKSGKQYSIKNALEDGRLTQYQLQQYKDGKMPISEFALLVAGETKTQPISMPSYSRSISTTDDQFPISGIMDTATNTCISVRSAMVRKMIDATTAQKLLEAQAATGGIVDIINKERYSVHKAVDLRLIDSSHLQQLLNAQKAFTGVEDPVTRERLSIGEAVQKDWVPREHAMRYMEVQFLTGGLVDPKKAGRIGIMEAAATKMINSGMVRELQAAANYPKELTDPVTKEKINYKQAMDRCKVDPKTGLLMLPASSKDTSYVPSYYSHRSSAYGHY
ncbi:envoplakin a [Chanos chanos]|uniref:Envoplakin a n=1 Tax=Chanos chanos TaxID=29144 RepID=A0A6J2W5R7_CHACN|nr:envoplakin [Chanos chanos]